jgi:hypothetical protein
MRALTKARGTLMFLVVARALTLATNGHDEGGDEGDRPQFDHCKCFGDRNTTLRKESI